MQYNHRQIHRKTRPLTVSGSWSWTGAGVAILLLVFPNWITLVSYVLKCTFSFYHPHMRVGYVFSHGCVSVCLCVCLSVYLSVCLCDSVCPSVCISVQALTSEALHLETSLLVYRYIFTISRSSLSIKVIRSKSRSYEKTYNFTYFNMLILCMLLQIINKGKVTPQGHIKVKVKISISVPILCSPYCQASRWFAFDWNAFLFLS